MILAARVLIKVVILNVIVFFFRPRNRFSHQKMYCFFFFNTCVKLYRVLGMLGFNDKMNPCIKHFFKVKLGVKYLK